MLTRKNHPFIFSPEQINAQDDLKQAVINSPALWPLDHTSESPVIPTVDTSPIAISFHLCQCDDIDPRKQYYARFGSIMFHNQESWFSQPKLELYGLYRSLCLVYSSYTWSAFETWWLKLMLSILKECWPSLTLVWATASIVGSYWFSLFILNSFMFLALCMVQTVYHNNLRNPATNLNLMLTTIGLTNYMDSCTWSIRHDPNHGYRFQLPRSQQK